MLGTSSLLHLRTPNPALREPYQRHRNHPMRFHTFLYANRSSDAYHIICMRLRTSASSYSSSSSSSSSIFVSACFFPASTFSYLVGVVQPQLDHPAESSRPCRNPKLSPACQSLQRVQSHYTNVADVIGRLLDLIICADMSEHVSHGLAPSICMLT